MTYFIPRLCSANHKSFASVPPRLFLVGERETPFYLPEEILIQNSPYFQKMLAGSFKEGQSKDPVALPDESVDSMEVFFYWIMYGNSHLFDWLMDDFERVAKLWAFGDKIGSEGFQNEMVTLLTRFFLRWYGRTPDRSLLPTFDKMLAVTPPNSKLLAIICDGMMQDLKIDNSTVDQIDPFLDDPDNAKAMFRQAILYVREKSGRTITDVFDQTRFEVHRDSASTTTSSTISTT